MWWVLAACRIVSVSILNGYVIDHFCFSPSLPSTLPPSLPPSPSPPSLPPSLPSPHLSAQE